MAVGTVYSVPASNKIFVVVTAENECLLNYCFVLVDYSPPNSTEIHAFCTLICTCIDCAI